MTTFDCFFDYFSTNLACENWIHIFPFVICCKFWLSWSLLKWILFGQFFQNGKNIDLYHFTNLYHFTIPIPLSYTHTTFLYLYHFPIPIPLSYTYTTFLAFTTFLYLCHFPIPIPHSYTYTTFLYLYHFKIPILLSFTFTTFLFVCVCPSFWIGTYIGTYYGGSNSRYRPCDRFFTDSTLNRTFELFLEL